MLLCLDKNIFDADELAMILQDEPKVFCYVPAQS